MAAPPRLGADPCVGSCLPQLGGGACPGRWGGSTPAASQSPWGDTLPISVPAAYGIGLLVTFMALALMQRGQPALLYLVPCTLVTSCALALWRRELGVFWTGGGFAVNTSLL